MEKVKEAVRLFQKSNGFMVGFDLVGQEDPLNPLLNYMDALLYPQTLSPPVNLPYYFHAGETSKKPLPSGAKYESLYVPHTGNLTPVCPPEWQGMAMEYNLAKDKNIFPVSRLEFQIVIYSLFVPQNVR